MCVPCQLKGETTRDHDPKTHPYTIVEQHSLPIYAEDWGADEESLIVEGAEVYGLGSWADIAEHVGGYRTKEEVRDHYINIYINSPYFPLPARADAKDTTLMDQTPREVFQARKKRRIEERKEAARTAPPPTPKQKPTASVPACHEVGGYMPGRLEFEVEFCNEAEEAVQHMQFDPGDGINPRTGELEPEMELKMTVMEIYNSRLTARADRKKVIFEHHLLDYRKNAAVDKKRTKEERDLVSKAKPFARIMNHADFENFTRHLEYEHDLRSAITQLQDWRRVRITDVKEGEKYESDKQIRAQRPAATGAFDRLAGIRPKPTVPIETPSATAALTAPDLPERLKHLPLCPIPSCTQSHPHPPTNTKGPLTNGNSHNQLRTPYTIPPLPATTPLKLNNENASDFQLLTKEERELCATLRILPKPYLAIKEGLMREAVKAGGGLKRKCVREVCKVCFLPPFSFEFLGLR